MRSTAQGQRIRAVFPPAALRPRVDVPGGAAAAVYNDYWWGTGVVTPPAPVKIPICWLTQPVPLRRERPTNAAEVSVPGAPTGRYQDDASIAAVRRKIPFTATLQTSTPSDAVNLAHHAVTYGQARTRSPRLVIDLLFRTDAEKIRLLRIKIGSRIELTDVPANFPAGAAHLVVTGVSHEIGLKSRKLSLTTQAVVGSAPGVAGPWFRLGASALGGTDSLLP
jgi:hypothetical protein